MGQGMMFIAWAILLAMLFFYFREHQAEQFNPNREFESVIIDGRTTVQLRANKQNHFLSSGKINNQAVVFLVDTGATNVALSEKLARRLKLPAGYPSLVETANGSVKVYSTTIDQLQIGEITLYDVSAQINPGMNNMDEILLGMSALSRVEFSQRDGILTLRQ